MAKHKPKTVVRLSKPARMPKAKEFLAHYFALERPNTTHLFFSKGIIDFLLGLIIGILVGIIIAAMVAGTV
ncbi:MAG: hypothetical protein AABX60_01280 [Nanoarchaeota archaeon]